MTDLHTAAKQDIPDLIAGALGVSRGTAYDLMREALAEQQTPVQEPVGDMREWCAQLCEWLPVGTGFEGRTFAEAIRGVGRYGIMAKAFTAPPAQQCKWPTCQSEEYQQALAQEIERELVGEQPAQQEPIDTLIAAWQALEETSGHVLDEGDVEGRMHMSVIRSAWEQMDSLVRDLWDERGCK